MDSSVNSDLLLPRRRTWRERNDGPAVALLAAPALLFTTLLFLYPLWNLIQLSFNLPHFGVDSSPAPLTLGPRSGRLQFAC
jgi:ABC-type sugar transport system permease subunit